MLLQHEGHGLWNGCVKLFAIKYLPLVMVTFHDGLGKGINYACTSDIVNCVNTCMLRRRLY